MDTAWTTTATLAVALLVSVSAGCSPDQPSPTGQESSKPTPSSTGSVPPPLVACAFTPLPADEPAVYRLPRGEGRPEGITAVSGDSFVVGVLGNGALYRGRLGSPTLRLFLPPRTAGRDAVLGLHTDRRGRLFVAGYDTGRLLVYDAKSGRRLATRSVEAATAVLNDLVVTADAVYVTDSALTVVYRASIDGAEIGRLEPWFDPRSQGLAAHQLNGIAASPDGATLLISSEGTSALLAVDTASARGEVVDLQGATVLADGLLLDGRTLYAVGAGVQVLTMSRDLRSGTLLAVLRSNELHEPATLTRIEDTLLVTNLSPVRPGDPPTHGVTALGVPDCAG